MKKQLITLLALALATSSTMFAQLEITTDSRTVSSQVYLQFEDGVIVPGDASGVSSVDGTDSTYIKSTKTTVSQEPNAITVDEDENVLWMDYDGYLKFDETILNKEAFSFSCDLKWSGSNNVWYMGLFALVGYDSTKVAIDGTDTVPAPAYRHTHFIMNNPGAGVLAGGGISAKPFPKKNNWAHMVFTYEEGFMQVYMDDSLVVSNDSSQVFHNFGNLSLYLGIKATVNDPETGTVDPGHLNGDLTKDSKETQLYLDDVALFDVALTAEEVSKVYAASQGEVASLQSANAETTNVYPNPVSNTLYFKNTNARSVVIYNLTGKMVQSSMITDASVDMSQLSSGVYFVNTLDDNQRVTSSLKVMKR